MQWSDISFQPPAKTLRQFAAIWLLFFVAVAARQHFKYGHERAALVLLVLAVVVGLAGLVRPHLVKWVYVGAMIVAFPIGWVVSLVAMAAIFFLVFTPLALAFRLAKVNLLSRQRADVPSYWVRKPGVSDPRRYFSQF
jgi:hypothetical protein